MTVSAPTLDRVVSRGYRYRWMVMAVVIVADVMDLLDATIANLAGPSIRPTSAAAPSTLQWVLAAYTMSFAIGLVISARLGDLVGRRRMFIIGMVGFTLASLLCGLAPTAGLLIAARVLQGLFGAAMIPQGLAMVKQSFAPEDLQKAFIPFGPIMGLSAVLGPILAGVLLDADLLRHRLADDLPDQRAGRPGRRLPRLALPPRRTRATPRPGSTRGARSC